MVTMWTSSVAILLQQAIKWYSRTTVWKWLQSWDVTNGLSRGVAQLDPHTGGSGQGPPTWLRGCLHPFGGHYAPCLRAPKDAGPGLQPCLLRGQRDGEPTAEREEVRRPVRDGVPGGVHPDCTLALHADTDWLWEVCPTYADIASAPGNGLPKQEVRGILLEGSGVRTCSAVWTSE